MQVPLENDMSEKQEEFSLRQDSVQYNSDFVSLSSKCVVVGSV